MSAARFDALRSLGFAGISAVYATLGPAATKNFLAFRVINNTDGDLIISFNGTTDNLFLPAFSFVLYDIAANAAPIGVHDSLALPQKVQVYVRESTAPTVGAVYFEGLYAGAA